MSLNVLFVMDFIAYCYNTVKDVYNEKDKSSAKMSEIFFVDINYIIIG